jgi:hypothetical protein
MFGVHLALLRVDTGCPAGSYAPGAAAAPTAAALTAVLAALAVLAGHALASLATGLLVAAGGRALRVTRAVRHVARRIATLAAQACLARPWRTFLAMLATLATLVGPERKRRLGWLGFTATGFRPVAPWSPAAVSLRGPPVPSHRAGLGAQGWLTA